jgi:sugar transferase (PEP-CTERM/EpsH1 system associated)
MTTATTNPGRRPRVLMLTHRTPYPPDRGDRIRSYHLARLLARHFDLDLAACSDDDTPDDDRRVLEQLADRVAIHRISWLVGRIRGGMALGVGQPITPAIFFRRRLAATVRQWHRDKPFDAVLTYCTGMTLYARDLIERAGFRGRHVLDLVDVDSVKWQNYASMTNPPMKLAYAAEAKLLREVEAGRHDRFDAITVVSDAEAQAYRGCVRDDAPLHVVPNGVDMDYFAPLPDAPGHTLLFVGVLNYRPNAQGLTWFVEGVLPGIRQRVPQTRLVVVGKHPTRMIRRLAQHEGVEVVGEVADVREYMAQAAAVIAPLRVTMGVQNKVLEAMSSARAVICSPGAARGIDATDGEHLLIADDPGQWVERCARVLTDADLRHRLAAAARRRVEERYTWDTCLAPMLDLLRA